MKKANLRALAAGLAASVAMTCFGGLTVGAASQAVGEAAQAIMPTRVQALEALERANDYWITNHKTHGRAFWDNAAYHVGNMEAYFTTGIEIYRNFSEAWAIQNSWKGATSDNKNSWKYSYGETMDYVLFGDWQICFQTYIDLYNAEVMESKGATRDETKVARAKEVMGYEISTSNNDYWWWADSLFMVMPLMTKMYVLTGNVQYLDKQYEYFHYAAEECEGGTKDGMWDDEYKLFHRDGKYIYPDHKTDSGKKDFWARGSGWVFAGLARVLSDMPTDYEHRDYFLDKYTQMAEGVKATQQVEGFWSRSMADRSHADGFEASGTSFFTYGLAWGINSGYLDRDTYLDTCLKGWYFLYNTSLQSDGCLGYMQPIGENAKQSLNIGARDTQNFGVGAFLLASSEVSKMAGGVDGDQTSNGDVYPYLMRKMVGKYAIELNSPHFYVDGMINHMDNNNHNQKSYLKNGNTMIPVRVVKEYMGGNVVENGNTITVTRDITNGNTKTTKTVVFTLDSLDYTVDGAAKTLTTPVEKSDLGYICVPVRALMEGLGYHIWYSAYGGTNKYASNTDSLDAMIVISEKVDPFFDCDANAVEMLRWMISASEHYPTRPNQTAKNYTVEKPKMAGTTAIGTQIPLTSSMVTASATPEAQNNAAQTVDNNVNTRWAAQGSQYLTIDLGTPMQIACVGVRMMQYSDGRTINYGVSYSADGNTYTSAFTGSSTTNGGVWEFPKLNGATARYIRINLNGSTTNDWASLADVAVFQGDENSPETTVSGSASTSSTTSSTATGTKVTLTSAMVTASATPESDNNAAKTVDGNGGTYWAAQGSQYLTIDIGSTAVVSTVGVQMRSYDDGRTVNYSVSYSADGSNYSSVFNGSCPSGGAVMEYIPVAKNARYIRVGVNGSTTNDWASLAEVEVYTGGTATADAAGTVQQTTINSVQSDTPTGTKINLTSSMLKASAEPQSENPASAVVDGNASTVWAAENSQNMVIDLGSAMGVTCVGVQMKDYGDGRTVNYGISVSTDGTSYTPVFSGACAPSGGVKEYHTVGANVRYVKVDVNGNSVSSWASVAEIEVYNGAVSGSTVTASGPVVMSSISSTPVGVQEKLKTAGTAILVDEDYPASAAVDGLTSTSWKGNANHSLVVEMNRSRTVTTVGVLISGTKTVNYSVAVSEDGSSWTTVYTGTSVSGAMAYHPCEAKGKYVMITLAEEARVAEVEVYGAE